MFGADTFDDLGKAADGFRCIKNDDIIRGMSVIMPVLKAVQKAAFFKKIAQKILIFEKA